MEKPVNDQPVILVTGAAGFIGSHVCEKLLKEDHVVIGLDNFDDFYPADIKKRNVAKIVRTAGQMERRFDLLEADIRDGDRLACLFKKYRVDAVVHLAARVGVRSSMSDPALYASVNIDGTKTLLSCSSRFDVRRFVFASSSSVYGNSCPVPFAEKEPVIHPISPYAVTKKKGEELCRSFYESQGIHAACLRFFTVFGPRQRPDLAIHTFVRLMLEGKCIPMFGDGSSRRDYTYISDAVDGIYRALLWTGSAKAGYDIFNIGKGRPVALSEMIHILANVLGVEPVIDHLAMQPGDVLTTYADVSHARMILGYHPQMSFREGIEAFVKWYGAENSTY